VKEQGTFTYADQAIGYKEASDLLREARR
jgi:hypothetical protein